MAKLKLFKAGFNSEFSFSLTGSPTKTKECNLSYYFLIAVGRTDGFMPFPLQNEKHFWLLFELRLLIPNDDNRYGKWATSLL